MSISLELLPAVM